jgi:hypothetical protein
MTWDPEDFRFHSRDELHKVIRDARRCISRSWREEEKLVKQFRPGLLDLIRRSDLGDTDAEEEIQQHYGGVPPDEFDVLDRLSFLEQGRGDDADILRACCTALEGRYGERPPPWPGEARLHRWLDEELADSFLGEDIRRARRFKEMDLDLDIDWAFAHPEALGPDWICWVCQQPSVLSLCDACDLKLHSAGSESEPEPSPDPPQPPRRRLYRRPSGE